MRVQKAVRFVALTLMLAACSGDSNDAAIAESTTTVVATTQATAASPGTLTDLEALAGTWYLMGPTNSAMHFTAKGEWWWAKGGLALGLKMEREPDGHVAFEDDSLVFLDDNVCSGEPHRYMVNVSADGIEFVGDDPCLRRSLWLFPPAGDTIWNPVADE